MSVARLLGTLTKAGVKASLQDNNLKLSAAKGALTPELKAAIVENKAALVEYLRTFSQSAVQDLPPLVPRQAQGPTVLSFAQQRLWFIDQLEGGSAHYNSLDTLVLTGTLYSEAFVAAVHALIVRHHVLRTRYILEGNEPRQVLIEKIKTPVSCKTLGDNLGSEAQHARINHLALEEVCRPFDLTTDVLVRVLIISLSKSEHLALITTHHIASDAQSRAILKHDLLALYESIRAGGEASLVPLKIQYADYAKWQREWLQQDVLEKHLAYWCEALEGAPLMQALATDRLRSEERAGITRQHEQYFSTSLGSAIHALCADADVTLFIFLHAAFSAFLSRYSGEDDIVIGTAISGRTHLDLEPLIGFFVNDLVLRSQFSSGQTFDQYLTQHKATVLDAYQHQFSPFEALVEKINPDRSLNQNPLFQVKLDVKGSDGPIRRPDKYSVPENNIADQLATQSREDLYLNVNHFDDDLYIQWNYDSSLFERDTISRMADCFATFIEAICASSSCAIDALAILPCAQRDILLEGFNGTYQGSRREATVLDIIERQAQENPHTHAVVFADETLGFGELNARANRLARYLISLGAGKNTRVVLCLSRSLDIAVGILSTLKSGAAYVPLDPDYPSTRLNYILDDCGADIVLTQQDLIAELDFGERKVLPLDGDFIDALTTHLSANNVTVDERALDADQLAYAIYTSGSTGERAQCWSIMAILSLPLWRGRTPIHTSPAFLYCYHPTRSTVPLPVYSGRWRQAVPW